MRVPKRIRFGVALVLALAGIVALATGCTPTESAAPGAAPTGACAHPYFPVRKGATWVYQTRDAGRTVDTVSDVRPDGFTLARKLGDARSNERWTCTAAGLRRADQLPQDLLAGSYDTRWNTERLEGLDLARALAPRAHWRLELVVRTSTRAPGAAEWQRRMTSDHFFLAGATERVTVPAGTFDAVPVRETITRSLERPTGDNPAPTTIETTTWWARGVGWIKRRSQRIRPVPGPEVLTELVSSSEARRQ